MEYIEYLLNHIPIISHIIIFNNVEILWKIFSTTFATMRKQDLSITILLQNSTEREILIILQTHQSSFFNFFSHLARSFKNLTPLRQNDFNIWRVRAWSSHFNVISSCLLRRYRWNFRKNSNMVSESIRQSQSLSWEAISGWAKTEGQIKNDERDERWEKETNLLFTLANYSQNQKWWSETVLTWLSHYASDREQL